MSQKVITPSLIIVLLLVSSSLLAAPPYPRTFQYQDTAIGCNDAVTNAVGIGNRRHYYSFFADAGATVTFELAFTGSESDRRGAEIWIYSTEGVRLAHSVSWFDPQITLDYRFEDAGEYYIYVSHADFWGLDGVYDYELSASCDPLCAQLWIELLDPGYEGVFVYQTKHFEAGQEDAAWAYGAQVIDGTPTPMQIVAQDVKSGRCCDLELDPCDASDPQVCAADNIGGGLEENICWVQNEVHNRTCEWSFAEAWYMYTYDLNYCQ